ncbi:MAG: hypothetical protein ABW123_05020 [Cystobacter sp.]
MKNTVGLLMLMLVTTSTGAAEARTRLIKTVFHSETGERSEFNVAEGGSIRITHLDTKREYRLVPEFTGEDIQFKIYDVASEKLLDTLAMSGMGLTRSSLVVPFSLSVDGIEENAEQTPSPSRLVGEAPVSLGKVCCLTCGRYGLCCEPPRGRCCTLSSSCGLGCRVCN